MLKNEMATEEAVEEIESTEVEQFTSDYIETIDPISPAVQDERRKAFLEQLEQDEKKKNCSSRDFLYHQGYEAGYAAAADDYLNENVKLELFAVMKDLNELGDHYALGFETGYFRKLAEVLVF